ncbi:MAG TPA: glycogen-binding domain-containing protein, partial [Gemmatimonadaceae bacterium]|nr:glycogen-binding domain-containing protein [Gemmatimonadaceae bacterium]
VAWSGNRAMADALVGARPAIGTVQRGAAWAEVGGAARLRGSVWIAGAAGLTPSRPDLGITHRRFARLGLQLTPGVPLRPRRAPEPRAAPAAFTLREAGQGAYVVSLRLPQARLVEIAGDFSGWRPVALAQVAPDRWETVIRLAPGAHRVSLRVDGDRWMAPPGSTSVEDDFGGSAGIVVAR